MKILVLCPKIPKLFDEENTNVLGGWIDGILLSLSKNKENDYFAFVQSEEKIEKCNEGIHLKTFKDTRDFVNASKEIDPDIIQVFGTENKMLNEIIALKLDVKVCVWIQGVLFKYYEALELGVKEFAVHKNIFHHIAFNLVREMNKYIFQKRVKNEGLTLARNDLHFIGRTKWDKQSIFEINKNPNYHTCGEILREEFYSKEKWNIENIEKHTIYMSQGDYSIKGLHIALYTLREVKNKYPDVKLKISGFDISKNNAVTTKFGASYSNCIENIIEKYNLEDNVVFTGFLNAQEVKNTLLKTNVYLMPSTIENSPNGLGEALILGVPCVCSDVGGISDFVEDGVSGYLYKCLDYSKAAQEIIEVFEGNKIDIEKISRKAIETAEFKYSKSINTKTLESIYREICNSETE